MRGLEIIFADVWNRSLAAGCVILVVLAARGLLRKAPGVFSCLLWAAVAFRLVCPVALSTPFSIFNQTELTGFQAFRAETDGDPAVTGAAGQSGRNGTEQTGVFAPGAGGSGEGADTAQAAAGEKEMADPADSGLFLQDHLSDRWSLTEMGGFLQIRQESSGETDSRSIVLLGREFQGAAVFAVYDLAVLVWTAGVLCCLLAAVLSVRKTRKKVAAAVRLEGNVYECDRIRSPFVFGLIRPRIYIPFRLPAKQRELVLEHERCHIRRGDFLVRPLAWLLVCIYWFCPLVWAAYLFMCKDMEQNCDEKVARSLNEEERKAYGKALYSFAVNRRFPELAVLAFGEGDTKKRIQKVLDYQKPPLWKRFLLSGFCLLVLAVCVTNAMASEAQMGNWQWKEQEPSLSPEQYEGVDAEFTYNAPESARSFGFLLQTYIGGKLTDERLFFSGGVEEGGFFSAGDGMDTSVPVRKAEGGIAREGSGSVRLKMNGADNPDLQGEISIDGYTISSEHFTDLSGEAGLDWMRWSMQGGDSAEGSLDLSPDQPKILAVWQLDDAYFPEKWEDGAQRLEEFPELAAQSRITVILKVVFSEKSQNELSAQAPEFGEEEQALYAAKNPYVGDHVADGALLGAMKNAGLLPEGSYTMELGTDAEPYFLKLCFAKAPEDWLEFAEQMDWAAAVLLALTDNLSEVRWSFPNDGTWGASDQTEGMVTVYRQTEDIQECLTDGTDIKEYGASMERLHELLQLRRSRMSEEGRSVSTLASIGGADGPAAVFLAGKKY